MFLRHDGNGGPTVPISAHTPSSARATTEYNSLGLLLDPAHPLVFHLLRAQCNGNAPDQHFERNDLDAPSQHRLRIAGGDDLVTP